MLPNGLPSGASALRARGVIGERLMGHDGARRGLVMDLVMSGCRLAGGQSVKVVVTGGAGCPGGLVRATRAMRPEGWGLFGVGDPPRKSWLAPGCPRGRRHFPAGPPPAP